MKKLFIILFAVLSFLGCRNDKDTPGPGAEVEDKDWHILRSPDNREIQAVYGDIDGTLLITDRLRIYYTRDKGKTWTQADYKNSIGLSGFGSRNDTLFVMDTETSNSSDPGNRYAIRPYYFSVDGGTHWEELALRWTMPDMKVSLNYANSGNGIRFSIDRVYHSSGIVEDIGLKTENGRKISLPQRHALTNVYFDQKSRLYVAASAPLCDRNGYLTLCDDKDVRGTLYISKKAMDY
ncbi:glycoside hydrolase [Dyadobacter sp. CY261]|uniref:sialidase family protein n=1 Tax=Dyadobacter sp. CY261 TaxID=2907203 RepID=UPI001F24B04E|nr:sialidase family protein [Dyadobacter sp. CY261]MCF0074394.1 glycoside hydrolase [Dyadobacter sp. CY261]